MRFLPPQAGDALADLYRAADIVAVPSHNESFGLVALEAQACGTPVVAAAVGGLVTAVRDSISGVLVDGHDPSDWARVLRRPAGAARPAGDALRGARSSTPRSYSWSRTAAGLLAVYREAMVHNQAHARRRAGRRTRHVRSARRHEPTAGARACAVIEADARRA